MNHYFKTYYIIGTLSFILVSFFYGAGQASALQPLRFSASVGEPFSNLENTAFEDRLVKALFKRLNLEAIIRFVPAERAMINLNEGLDDGCLSRIDGLRSIYPDIRQIPEISLERDFMVFTVDADFTPNGWASLGPFHVGIITGWKILERNVTHAKSITKVKNGTLLFGLLNAHRTDVILYNRFGGLQLAKNLEMDTVKVLEPPLVRVPHFFYLNKKHEGLAVKAAKELQTMKIDGTYRRIFDTTLRKLIE